MQINQNGILDTECLPSAGVVAIVGKSGTGKTNLVLHFLQEYPPTDLLVFSSSEKLCQEYSTSRHVYTHFNQEKYNKLATGRHGTHPVIIVDTPITSKMTNCFRNAHANGVLVILIVHSENSIPDVLCDLIRMRFYAGKFSKKEIKVIYQNVGVYNGHKSFAKTLSSVVETPYQFFITNSSSPPIEFSKYIAPKCELEITMDEIHNIQEEQEELNGNRSEKEDHDFVLVESFEEIENIKGMCQIM